ncbi:hypothetical protein SynMINOS11_01693 [Synechococcus sp. Minos11]|nr:hypothetical protein SynMINOS11_01693 [Synechococcus sp. Minos11]
MAALVDGDSKREGANPVFQSTIQDLRIHVGAMIALPQCQRARE